MRVLCVCMYHLNRCKTSYYRRGVWHSCPTIRNEAEWDGKRGRFPVPADIFINIYICMYIYTRILYIYIIL
jgi:hypothetical protein